MKVCTGCGELKSLEGFSFHKGFRDGRNSKCKTCKTALQTSGYRAGKYKKVPYSYAKLLKGKYRGERLQRAIDYLDGKPTGS